MSNVLATNKTDSAITVSSWKVFYINSTNAELITVYDLNNNPYDCFKYLLNNVSWFYVLDGVHSIWVNNLSSIGYTEDSPVILPIVNTSNDVYHCFRFNRSGDDYTFSASGTTSVYSDSSTNPTYVDWDSTKVYGVIKYYNSDQTSVGRQGIMPIEAPSWGEAGKVYMKNNSGEALTVSKIRVATCDDLSSTVAIVYDAQNTTYNAFKYTTNNTDYYYVLDETQTDWAEDLSSIGYSLTPTLPMVSIDANPVGSPTQTLTVDDFTGPLHYMGSGGWHGEAISYDTSKKYSLTTYNDGTTSGLQACGIFTPLMVSTQAGGPYYVGVKNISQSAQSFMSVYVATCSDSSVIVLTVYNQFNTAYNSFKHTVNNTDYYYVLDGIQTDWVTDLSSIGYSLIPNIITLYLKGGEENKYFYQANVTSSYSGSPNNSNLISAYTDPECTHVASYDATKSYVRGYIQDNIWKKYPIQSVSDMPSSTVSTGETSTVVIYNDNGTAKLWFITNSVYAVLNVYTTSSYMSYRFVVS